MGAFKRARQTITAAEEFQRQAAERRRREAAEAVAEAERIAKQAAGDR